MGTTVRAEAVEYRRGFVEISNVHPGSVNLEAWRVPPGVVLELNAYGRPVLPEDALIANVEIELSPQAAEELIAALRSAIDSARAADRG